MASNREQQDVLIVISTQTAKAKDTQDFLIVLGPTVTIVPSANQLPQVCVIA